MLEIDKNGHSMQLFPMITKYTLIVLAKETQTLPQLSCCRKIEDNSFSYYKLSFLAIQLLPGITRIVDTYMLVILNLLFVLGNSNSSLSLSDYYLNVWIHTSQASQAKQSKEYAS